MSKKRGNGEGSITFHKGSHRYMAQYTVNGNRKTMYQKKNESLTDFKKRFTKTVNEVNQGTYIEKTNNTNHKYNDIILLLLNTGMRVGEVLALTISRIIKYIFYSKRLYKMFIYC